MKEDATVGIVSKIKKGTEENLVFILKRYTAKCPEGYK